MTGSEWECETYRRFLMVIGGSEIPEENERARALMREFLHFWPNAREAAEWARDPLSDQRAIIENVTGALYALATTPHIIDEWGPISESARVAASGIETRSATDAERRGPKGESPTVEDGDAQQPTNEYPHP